MAFWNGENIYVVDLLRTYQNGNAKRQDEHFYDVLKSTQERPSDLIDLTYRELCFNLETFYGCPSATAFSEAVKNKGLDAALSQQDPETRTLLLSADRAEYATGLHRLFDYLMDDGGHTGFSEYTIRGNGYLCCVPRGAGQGCRQSGDQKLCDRPCGERRRLLFGSILQHGRRLAVYHFQQYPSGEPGGRGH